MPQFADGTKISEAEWDRLLESIPASYVVWKDTSTTPATYRAECLLKDGTDYSGADASTVIQSAINGLGTGGGKIQLKGDLGTLSASLTVPTGQSNLSIVGEGRVKTSLKAPASARAFSFIGASTQRNFVLKDMKIIGNGLADTVYFEGLNEIYIENVEVDQGGIYFNTVYGIRIFNTLVWWSTGTPVANGKGLSFIASSDGEISVTVISGMGAEGVYTSDSTLSFSLMEVSNCGNNAGSASRDGFTLVDSPNVKITDSIILENYASGIRFYANSTPNCNSGIVSDNIIIRNSKVGVGIYDGVRIDGVAAINYTLISNNQIYDDAVTQTQNYGVRTLASTDYIFIIGNRLTGNLTDGISYVGTHNIIRDNLGYGNIQSTEHHTALDLLTSSESGSIHTNLGAAGSIKLTLPQDALAGMNFEFVVMTAQQLQIDPGAAGAIYVNGAKQADDAYIWADDEGESVKLVADGNGDWIAIGAVGTWTVV